MKYQLSDYLYKTAAYLCLATKSGTATATGFFFRFNSSQCPILITNRHVLENTASVIISTRPRGQNETAQFTVSVNSKTLTFHPNSSIDLAMLKITRDIIILTENLSFDDLDITSVSESMIPSIEEIKSMNFIEDIIMFGCPNGLWINKSAFPIARKGITATPASSNSYGMDYFYVDIGSFNGSSGSPIFLCTDESVNKTEDVRLLGVFYQAQYSDSKILQPDSSILSLQEKIHLGKAISSVRILDFKPYIK